MKYMLTLILLLCIFVYSYLTFFFGKTLSKSDIEKYTFVNNDTTLKMRYFGTMCFYIEYKGKAILTDPFFSNPDPLKIVFGSVPQTKYLSLFSRDELHKINMILIGHAHYDHCMELPLFINNPTRATVVGNQSVINLFNTQYPHNNYINSDDYKKSRQWFYNRDSTIRIFCIESHHSPHFGNTVLMSGENLPQTKLPSRLTKWNCGKSTSYIVDFMDHNTIAKRIVLNGGKTSFPSTEEDIKIVQQHPADIAIVISWNKDQLTSKFNELKSFQPSTVILGHWNNFFNSNKGDNQYIRKSQLPEALQYVNKTYPQYKTRIMLPEILKNK